MDLQTIPQLHGLLVNTISNSFQRIKASVNNERFYGFALHLNKDCRSFYCIGNTLDCMTNKFMTELRSIEDVTDYLWFPSEWAYPDLDSEDNKRLTTHIGKEPSSNATVSNDEFLNILIEALQACDKLGLFGIGILREKMTVFIDSNNDKLFDLAERSSQVLNPPYVHNAFLKRFEPHDPGSLTYRLINELVTDY